MSVEQVKAFFDKVKADSSLAQKLKDAQAAYKGDTSDKTAAFAAVVIPIAAEAGFTFTVEDFKAAFDNSDEGEVSADELDAVAGGDCSALYRRQKPGTCGKLQFYINFCDTITY